jgi:hypothetical protein
MHQIDPCNHAVLQHFISHQILGQHIFFPSLLVQVFFLFRAALQEMFFKINPPPSMVGPFFFI